MERNRSPQQGRRNSGRRNSGRRGSRRNSRELYPNGPPGANALNPNNAKEVQSIRRHSAEMIDLSGFPFNAAPRPSVLERIGQRVVDMVSTVTNRIALWSPKEHTESHLAKVQQRRAELYHQWRDTVILSLIFICESLPFIVGSYSALRDCSVRCQSLPLVASAFLGTGASLSALKCASESAMVSLFNVLWGSASLFCSLYAGICLLSSSDCSPFEKSIGAFLPIFPAFGTLHAAAPELRVAVGDSIRDYVKEEKLRQSQRKAYNRNDNRSRIHRIFFNLLLKTKSGEEGVLLYREEMASRRGRPEFRAMRTNPSLPNASQPALVHGSSSIVPDGRDARMSLDSSGNTGVGSRISGVGQALKERINNIFSPNAQDS